MTATNDDLSQEHKQIQSNIESLLDQQLEKPDIIDSINVSLNNFYQSHIVETADQSMQIFRSFTYGEMIISFLLLCILLLHSFKWIYEVIR